MARKACAFCRRSFPALKADRDSHLACAEAWGLDFDPTSDAQARVFLDRRRIMLGQRRAWTLRLAPGSVVRGVTLTNRPAEWGYAVREVEAGQRKVAAS